jgi:HAE1 family hydrophobic/amphiphilic exporter-1
MSKYSVKRPITVLMGVLIIIVLGVFSVTRLPLTLFPEINLPYVVTITDYQGASPEEVEQFVAKPIESAVSTIGNFDEVQSMSNEHFGISIVTFQESTNMDTVVVELRELLNNTNFPEGVGSTRILRISPDMLPVMTVTLFKTYDASISDEEALIRNTEWIERNLMLELQSIPGIADVSISGQADVILEVKLDNEKLNLYGLTEDSVLQTIEDQNVGGLIGIALDNGELRMLYLGNTPSSLEDIKALPITSFEQTVLTLEDLVLSDGIRYVNSNTESYSKINGMQGIQVSFQKQSNYGITEVTDEIIAKLDGLMALEGDDAHYSILLDQGEYINLAISSVLNNIIIGGILAIFILFLFLRDVKPTLIVGLSIPISVVAAFMLMYFSNVSLNIVSMGGLALGIGMLVDNSIVVIENIYRMIHEGKSKTEAAVEGAKQVAGAITASTLTTVAVFLPIIFVQGLVAEIFLSMALTIAFSLGASLIIALTVVPSMASRMLNVKEQKKPSKFLNKAKESYEKSIGFAMHHKILSILIVLFMLFGSFILVYQKGFILLPESDEGAITVSIETTSDVMFADKALFADLLSEEILQVEDVETVSASISSQSGFGFGPMMAMGGGAQGNISITINLKDNRKDSTTENEVILKALIDDFINENEVISSDHIFEYSVAAQNSTAGLTGVSGINIKVAGYDLLTLEKISNDITSILEDTEGVIKADNGISVGSENVKITINQDQAMLYQLTNQDVMDNISYLYQNLDQLGSTRQVTVTIEGVDYTLEIPTDSLNQGISFDIFGDYKNFLSGMMLFDDQTRLLIDQYVVSSNQSIYVINAFLPTYVPGTPLKFIVNPFLRIQDNEIIMDPNPMSENPTLTSLILAPLFTDDESSITSIERITGFQTIQTDGNNRYVNVTAQIDQDLNVTIVSDKVTDAINAYLDSSLFESYGSGYYVTFEGENEEIMDAVSDLALAAIVAVLLVYMIMAIQFQSLIYPLIILGTIPLAFTGGLIALLITNSYLSLVSIMGLIILIGIVVNNGIVLIDYINKLRENGMQVKEAIIQAGQTRLRPILMTALTTILALLTLALGFGEGSELLQPMAITAIGGLIYATILTLYIIPVLYASINRKKIKIEEANHDAN